jgi:non-specific serine/threonine protein kinase
MSLKQLDAAVMPDGTIHLEWGEMAERAKPQGEELQNQIFSSYSTEPHSWFFQLGFCNRHKSLSPTLAFWRDFSGHFIEKLRLTPDLEKYRGQVVLPLVDEELIRFRETAPLMSGGEYLSDAVFLDLWAWLHETFAEKIAASDGSVAEFIKQYSPDIHLVGRIYFHLVENKKSETPFAFLATYSTRLNDHGESRHLPLKYALEEYRGDQEKLLQLLVTVHQAARRSEVLADLLDSGELFHPLSWSAKEAFAFLQEIPLYQEAGILCRIPDWWKGKAVGLGINITIGEKPPATVGMASLLDFRPRLMLGDTEISEEEARQLLQQSEGLAFLKNKWVAVDAEKLQQTLAAYAQARELNAAEGISFLDAMRFSMNPQTLLGPGESEMLVGVANGQWLQTVIARLHKPSAIKTVKTDKSFTASLRGYQQDGLQWLHYLHTLRFGACLADDMGLGKTVQLLAFLNALQKEKKKTGESAGASLLVIPASLLANWINEIQAFFPDLKYLAVHPDLHKSGKVPEPGQEQLLHLDLVITTYALIQRSAWMQEASWHYIILDEAQAIKNPGTKQTRAIKKLTSVNRIAMTGTPVENRLSDLWSLFDFLNPGLLGNAKEFSAFTKGLADKPNGYAGLRKVVSPFILRRLKTDKSIISDLPDKVEVKTWATMSKKQTVLYGEMVAGLKELIENTEGIQRKGVILSALMKFKQLCNHPAQYLGQELFAETDSGKFARLREICEIIHEKREKVLVFTQFKEMTGPLSRFLATIFQRQGVVLHGSIPVGKRKELIEKFQGQEYVPYFVLSLKAGGVGLNLTAANHVIHFDRWWNPAVENQATDRAFRIGQKKNVMVHKFLTKGTVEEKIDEMLTAKSQLAGEVVAASGENWITEMSNDQLFALFSLQP